MEQYRNPAVTVDMALFTREENPRILLIKRKNPPFQDHWALPGGFMDYDEEIEDAAYRELEEETGITGVRLEQIHAFGKVGRDPRGRTVSIVYRAVVDLQQSMFRQATMRKKQNGLILGNCLL